MIMKKILLVTAVLLCLSTSCNREKNIELVTFEYSDPACESCARISLNYPLTPGNNRTERKINAAMEQWVAEAIDLSQEDTPSNIQDAITEFKESYQRIRDDFPDEYHTSWETTVIGELCYQDKNLLAFCMETYSYTGGAHGYGSTHYLLFDKKKERFIERDQLIKDEEGLTALAEKKFRARYALHAEAPLNEQGFMFEGDRFHLPHNIGYTANGIKLIYNPYEIAPYSEGQITLEIPFEEVNTFLRYRVEPRL